MYDDKPSTRSGRAGQTAHVVDPTDVVAKTPYELDQVRSKGMVLWDRVTQSKDAEGRYFAEPFYKLPSKREYPDYYEIIKTPLSLDEIKKKLDKLEYTTIRAIRDDLNHVFVNAQRYNASGSPIFMDARQLKRVLKENFDMMSGQRSAEEEEGVAVGQRPTLLPDPVYAKRGPTLKPWLSKKLNELRLLKDQAGRVLTDVFEELPDRQQHPEYYTVITHPMSLGLVATKIHKRTYASVQQFKDDVNVIFANAMYYNEETSRIWKDAKLLQNHFNELMREQPPDFLPPRRYNTKRRREEELTGGRSRSVGGSEPPEGEGDDDEDEVDYTPSTSTALLPAAAQQQQHQPYGGALAQTSSLASVPPQTLPTAVSATQTAFQPIAAPTPTAYVPARGVSASGALPLSNGTKLPAASTVRALARLPLRSTQAQTGSASQTSAPSSSTRDSPRKRGRDSQSKTDASQEDDGDKPDSTSTKSAGPPSLVARFEVNVLPKQAPLVLSNDDVRQHALTLPGLVNSIEIVPVSADFSVVDDAGGQGSHNGQKHSLIASKASDSVSIKGSARPHPAFVTEPPPVGTAAGPRQTPGGPKKTWTVTLNKGLTVIEFVAQRLSVGGNQPSEDAAKDAPGGESKEKPTTNSAHNGDPEVYRLFVTR